MVFMDKSAYLNNLVEILMRRQCYFFFHYNVKSGDWDFQSNIPESSLLGENADDPIEGLLKSDFVECSDKPMIAQFYADFKRACQIRTKNRYMESIIHVKIDGKPTILSFAVYFTCDENGIATSYTGYAVSVSDVKTSNLTDKAAPFPVDKVMKNMMSTKENFAVVQFDIIRFKLINEQYGEKVGDMVLENIRTNLEHVWGREAVTARFGADIFTVMTEYSDIEELENRIKHLCDELQHYNDIEYKFSFGVYLVTDKSVPLRKMTDNAAIARKNAKGTAQKPIYYYEEKFGRELHTRHAIESEMQSALQSGQFQVYLQPKCNTLDGSVMGAEALVRWNHPEKGLIHPDKFIPVFESNGFIEYLDNFVHTEVCKILRKWLDAGIKAVPISVNVSRIYLGNPHLAEKIKAIVDKYNIPIELFQIEITETYENREAEDAINTFKDSGFTLLMDDFGSGFSSLNTLKNTRFDVIKLDREFFGDSMMTERGQKIVTHTIAMTNDIGLEVVAEGVETPEQADFLSRSGCKFAQGYLYSRPVPLSEFEKKFFGRII
jgi:diguanylate cyclase (GGDEF)-like protein